MKTYGIYPNCFYRVIVKGIIKNRRNQILLVKESSEVWDLPGGGIDHGESPIQALSRELKEEIGYTGPFQATYRESPTLYSPRLEGCVLFMVYDVTLQSTYEPAPTAETSEVAFVGKKSLTIDVKAIANPLVHRYVINSKYAIPFERT